MEKTQCLQQFYQTFLNIFKTNLTFSLLRIHPRNKKLVTQRLTTAALNIAYGQTEYPTNGPFPQSVDFFLGPNENTAIISFDQPIDFSVKEFGGFYVCCEADYNNCDPYNAWVAVSLCWGSE